ncbi:MAG: hypothetical protein LBU51_03800 [Bacteroidales bacterium]|jgi:hypothetical protein|nr:hypothetical protein [Bacteroidales bacterium]
MKKIFLSIIALLLTANIFAQEITSSPPKVEMLKHEVGVSIGAFPAIAMLYKFDFNPIIYPVLHFRYYYNFDTIHSLGILLSAIPFEGIGRGYHGCLFIPELIYKISYYHSDWVSFYLSIAVGMQLGFAYSIDFSPSFQFYPIACQLNLFGVQIGKIHSTFIELGYGSQGVVTIGYKHNFNKQK